LQSFTIFSRIYINCEDLVRLILLYLFPFQSFCISISFVLCGNFFMKLIAKKYNRDIAYLHFGESVAFVAICCRSVVLFIRTITVFFLLLLLRRLSSCRPYFDSLGRNALSSKNNDLGGQPQHTKDRNQNKRMNKKKLKRDRMSFKILLALMRIAGNPSSRVRRRKCD